MEEIEGEIKVSFLTAYHLYISAIFVKETLMISMIVVYKILKLKSNFMSDGMSDGRNFVISYFFSKDTKRKTFN